MDDNQNNFISLGHYYLQVSLLGEEISRFFHPTKGFSKRLSCNRIMLFDIFLMNLVWVNWYEKSLFPIENIEQLCSSLKTNKYLQYKYGCQLIPCARL